MNIYEKKSHEQKTTRYVPPPKQGVSSKHLSTIQKIFQISIVIIKLIAYNINEQRKERTKMAIQYKGRTYYYVDTIYDEDLVYDVYEDEYDNVYYKPIDILY